MTCTFEEWDKGTVNMPFNKIDWLQHIGEEPTPKNGDFPLQSPIFIMHPRDFWHHPAMDPESFRTYVGWYKDAAWCLRFLQWLATIDEGWKGMPGVEACWREHIMDMEFMVDFYSHIPEDI